MLIYSEHSLSCSILKKIYTKFILVTLVLFSNLIFPSFAEALSGVQMTVVDTLVGEDTFYSFENLGGVWDDSNYTLALRSPDLDVVRLQSIDLDEIKWLYPYRLDKKFISVAGRYDLFLLVEKDRFSEIVLRNSFEVKQKVDPIAQSDFNFMSWLRGSFGGFGGDEILLAQATLNRFDIPDLPAVVQVRQPLSFNLVALNAAQQKNVSYTGTVSISVLNDVNAVTPGDFTFALQNAGEQRFVDSLVFNSVGTKTIRIEDTTDSIIFAEFNVEVVDNQQQQNSGTLLQIESPISRVYTNNRILVKGQTEPGLEIIVLESGAELLRFDAEVDGSFTNLLPPLEDGLYVFQFKVNQTLSNPVNVDIKTGGVTVRSLNLSKESVSPVELISLEVEMNDGVSTVSAILNGVKTDLQKQDLVGTLFRGQITAPITAGSYPLILAVVDQVGSPLNINTNKVITVSSAGSLPNNNQVVSSDKPTKVTNITGESLDKRISLSWQSAQSNKGIVFYTIRYGTSPTNLDKIVDTTGNVTTWFVPNLVNGQSYYFQIFAVDVDGNEGEGSSIVTIAPGRPENAGLLGSADGKNTTSDTGPEMLLVLVLALLISSYIRFKRN